MIRNFIFDWSGTLVDDLPPTLEATNAVLRHHGIAPLTREEFRDRFRLPYLEFYAEILGDRAGTVAASDLEEVYHLHFRASPHGVTLLPHAREFLELCRRTGRRLFVLSSIHPAYFDAQAAELGLDGFFERVYAGVHDKTEGIARLMAENALRPAETAFVGDMVHDIDSARSGGVRSVAVLTGYDKPAKLMAAEPDIVVGDLSSLAGLLGSADWLDAMPVSTVGALVFDADGENVLLVRTHKWSDRWGIPGGKIRRGETSEAALRREIHEETGLRIRHIEFILLQDCIEPGEFMRSAHFLLLNYTATVDGDGEVRLNDEAEAFRWVPLERCLDLDLNEPTRVLVEAVIERRGRSVTSADVASSSPARARPDR